VVTLGKTPENRLLILDYAGEYVELLGHLPGAVLLRPGSIDFPLGINFFDFPRTLGMESGTAEQWIMHILGTLIRGKVGSELTPKMEALLQELVGLGLDRCGTFSDLFKMCWTLRTELQTVKKKLAGRQYGEVNLTEKEKLVLTDWGKHDLTIEAVYNRLRDLSRSVLHKVFFVQQTTVMVDELLNHHILLDLSYLRQQGLSEELLRLFYEFLLLYLSRGVAMRPKGAINIRNIVIFEEAQQLVPEVLLKRTLAEGTTAEEFIGTLGGHGLSLIFVSAQPGRLSRAIISGCHTKIVFPLQGTEASLFADALGVHAHDVSRLQEGECLVRAAGTGVVKVTAQTMREYKGPMREMVAVVHRDHPPELLQRTRTAYQLLDELPREYYRTLVEVIEEATGVEPSSSEKDTGDLKGTEEVNGSEKECWFFAHCQICTRTEKILYDGAVLQEAYWRKKNKAELITRLQYFSEGPEILFKDLLDFALTEDVPAPELTAFCAHQQLLRRCARDEDIAAKSSAFFRKPKEEIVRRFVENETIQTILDTWPLFVGFDASFDLIFNDSLNFQKTHHIRAAFKSSY